MWTEQVQNITVTLSWEPIVTLNVTLTWKHIWMLSRTIHIESLCRNWEPVRIPWQFNMEDTLVLRRKLKTATVLLVIFSKMRDIFSSNVILIKQKEKTYSQNWHTKLLISFIWLTKKNSFSLCATKTNKYLHGLANSFINLSKIELNTYYRYDAVCILSTLQESILCVYQFANLPVWMHIYTDIV